jgi:YD repeat-containing protein
MTALCVSQYPSATNPVAYAGAQNNPYSWQCYSLSTATTRTIDYTYDGLQRLTGAVESPGSSFAYSYDLAGNRTGVTVDGSSVASYNYDAADQVVGWTYDGAGNLTSDGTTSYSYDAPNGLPGDRRPNSGLDDSRKIGHLWVEYTVTHRRNGSEEALESCPILTPILDRP